MLIINAHLFTMSEQGDIGNGYILIRSGKIIEVGHMDNLPETDNENIVDIKGASVYPGFIDAHTHLGMFEDALGFEGDDGNEDTDPCMPHLRAIDAVNPYDACFKDAYSAGITSVITGPGSANPIGGQMISIKTFGTKIDDMVIKDPVSIKIALGENPKTVYREKNLTPVTRMATAAIIREQLKKAQKYIEQQDIEDEDDKADYDIKCESLTPLLKKDIPAHIHAHRIDDVFTSIRICEEFDIDYTIIHCTQGHFAAKELAANGVEVFCGPFLCERSKPELKDMSPASPGILNKAGVKLALITDHPVIPIQYLNICAGLAVREGMDYREALKAITIYPAEICGLSDRIGSIERGKDADLAIFDTDPLSLSAKPILVMIDGIIVHGGVSQL